MKLKKMLTLLCLTSTTHACTWMGCGEDATKQVIPVTQIVFVDLSDLNKREYVYHELSYRNYMLMKEFDCPHAVNKINNMDKLYPAASDLLAVKKAIKFKTDLMEIEEND